MSAPLAIPAFRDFNLPYYDDLLYRSDLGRRRSDRLRQTAGRIKSGALGMPNTGQIQYFLRCRSGSQEESGFQITKSQVTGLRFPGSISSESL
jgi:hypothetical protein